MFCFVALDCDCPSIFSRLSLTKNMSFVLLVSSTKSIPGRDFLLYHPAPSRVKRPLRFQKSPPFCFKKSEGKTL